MKVKIVQLAVGRNIASNQELILDEISNAASGEWIILPEASLSGYYPEESIYTEALDWQILQKYLNEIESLVHDKKCHCLVGSASRIDQSWRNSIYGFSYLANSTRHDKIKLSRLDRKHFTPGKRVINHQLDGVNYGMLACRELIFPTLWSDLKAAGAQIIFHLNNAIQPHDELWKHLLIARAVENAIFVVSVNNAAPPQQLASFVINPAGQILAETIKQQKQSLKINLDLTEVIGDLDERDDY